LCIYLFDEYFLPVCSVKMPGKYNNKKALHPEGPEYCVQKTHNHPSLNTGRFLVRFVCFITIISCAKI